MTGARSDGLAERSAGLSPRFTAICSKVMEASFFPPWKFEIWRGNRTPPVARQSPNRVSLATGCAGSAREIEAVLSGRDVLGSRVISIFSDGSLLLEIAMTSGVDRKSV